MFTTYILKSQKDQGYYFGHCQDFKVRLQRHNQGKVRCTKSRIPFILHYKELFPTKTEVTKENFFSKALKAAIG